MNNSICTLFDNILIDIHKFKSLQIYHIDFDVCRDGDIPVILLRISEKKKGFTDLAIEAAERDNSSVISQEDALATQYNCAVLYPNIDIRGRRYLK